MNEKLEVPGKP